MVNSDADRSAQWYHVDAVSIGSPFWSMIHTVCHLSLETLELAVGRTCSATALAKNVSFPMFGCCKVCAIAPGMGWQKRDACGHMFDP